MGYDFNSEEVDQSGLNDFDALPPGRYPCTVDSAELVPTKAGDGMRFSVCYSVAKGEYENRKIWGNYNIENPSEKARNIGRAQLAQALTALGHPKLNLESPELIYDKVIYLHLGRRKNKQTGELENPIKKAQSLAEVRAEGGTAQSKVSAPTTVTKASDLSGGDEIPF